MGRSVGRTTSSGRAPASSSSYVPASTLPRAKPSDELAFACGSMSMSSTRCSAAARLAARLTAVVVLPSPPFWLLTARMRGPVAARRSAVGTAAILYHPRAPRGSPRRQSDFCVHVGQSRTLRSSRGGGGSAPPGDPTGGPWARPMEVRVLSYFRHSYTSFEEFTREALAVDDGSLGKEELDLLQDLEDDDAFDSP